MAKNRFNKGIEVLKQIDETKIIDTNNEMLDTNNEILDTDNEVLDTEKIEVLNDKKDTKLNSILDSILFSEPTGSNCTFYLSYEVSEAINRVSKEKKISKSKIVDKILKQVLID